MKAQKTTVYLKLPFLFEIDKLMNDLSLIVDSNWMPHFNTSGYEGQWNAISLYANNGDGSNIFAHSSADVIVVETPIMKDCEYFKTVIDTFKCPILSARLLRLGVGAEIKPHRDYELGYEDGCFRLHIPILTNIDVRFILDGNQLTMLPGECWYTNVNYVHAVSNSGDTDRVHLVIDGQRNDWSDQLFFSLAPEESFQPIPNENESPETIRLMIEEFKRSNLPANAELIIELEQKLASL